MLQAQCAKGRDSITIDSICTVDGKAATAHAVVTGSFDSAYALTVTSQSEGTPGGKMTMTIVAEWLGPCIADQKPGDMIMANGKKANILDLQKRGTSPGIPLPPR
jgi:hypothetical protein